MTKEEAVYELKQFLFELNPDQTKLQEAIEFVIDYIEGDENYF